MNLPKVYAETLQACCTIPPAVAKNYTEKGKYIDLDGMTTCTLPIPSAGCRYHVRAHTFFKMQLALPRPQLPS